MNNELLRKQLILNALRNAKEQIREVYTDQETGEQDKTFGGDKELYELYYQINEKCTKLADDNRFWYNKD